MKLLRALVIVLLAVVSTGRADTTWVASGNVSGVWSSSGSPYMIHLGDITVAENETLVITPGVKVYFAGQFKLIVNGLLQAIGTESDSVWFTGSSTNFPFDSPQRWRGMRFIDAHQDCQLSYCSISYSGATGAVGLSYGGGIYCHNTDLRIDHSHIHHCHAGSNSSSGRGCGAYFYSSDVVLDFTTISNNVGTIHPEWSYPMAEYAGGFVASNCVLHARHCTIRSNNPGGHVGGILIDMGTVLTLDSCMIANNNSSEQTIGGMRVEAGCTVTMTGTTISENLSAWGDVGGLQCRNVAAVTMDACTIRANATYGFYGGPPFEGGAGVQIINAEMARISNCVIEDNGGGFGGGLLCNNTTIENTIFRRNDATDGGALASSGGNKIIGCRFEENHSGRYLDCLSCNGDGYGGAIYFAQGTDSVLGCRFSDNQSYIRWEGSTGNEDSAGWHGGALYCIEAATPYIVNSVFVNNSLDYSDGNGTGSVLYNNGGYPVLEFCTMVNNPASGGEIVIPWWGTIQETGGVIYSDGGSVTLKSCIMSNSVAATGVWFGNSGTGNVHHSDFFGISGGNFTGNVPVGLGVISTTNANGDPSDEFYNLYLDPEYVDGVNGDLHLSNSSPCIGGADPFSNVLTDYEHNARPLPSGSVRDMGAIESAVGGALMAVEDLVIGGSDEDQNDVVLRWNVVSGAQSYEVYSGEAQEFVPELFTLIGTTTDTTFVDNDVLLEPAMQRTYVVRASVLP